MVEPLVCLRGVEKVYEGASPTRVLRGIDLTIGSGESVSVVGPSGSGKSTLLNLIGGLDRPTAGEVIVAGRSLSDRSADELAGLRNREIGFVFQQHHLLPQCTVLENVLVPTLASPAKDRKSTGDAAMHGRRLLERVGLTDRLSHRPGQLSGGERQRVAVVRALINEPKLLLADEPTGSLDRAASENLARLLVELNREEGVAMVVITHETDLAKRMSRVYELREGTLIPREDIS